MRAGILLILFLISIVSLAQERGRITIDIPTDQKPWNNIDLNNDPGNFQFAIVTDRTGGVRPGVFLKGIQKLNLLQPEFVMSVGDLIEGYTEDTTVLNTEWKEFNGFIDSLQVPFFYVPGNHDITNQVMEDKWKELFGVTYYHFVYQDVLFLCLNSEDNRRGSGRGTLDTEQYEYVKKALEENLDVRWTLVFIHQPLWVQKDTKRWKDVEELLSSRPHNVFAGHYHRYWKSLRNNGNYIALATTGGSSPLRGPSFGEFDHVVWVTMTDEGPILANLLLEGIWDENVVTDELVDFVRNRPFPIRIEPVYLEKTSQEVVSTKIRITNDSDFRMTASLEGQIHHDLFYELSLSEKTMEPNSVEIIDLVVKNISGKSSESIKPLSINSQVVYDYPNRPELAIREQINFSLLSKNYAEKTNQKIKVDGKLKEWNEEWIEIAGPANIAGNRFHYNGDEDLSMRFQMQYDDEFVYIAAEVFDDDLVIREGESPYRQDAIALAIDPRNMTKSQYSKGQNRGTDWIRIIHAFGKKDNVSKSANVPQNMVSAFNKTDKGTAVEFAIPRSYFDSAQDGNWKTFRLGLGYMDFDKKGEERNDLYWYPAWNSNSNILGSGMIFRR